MASLSCSISPRTSTVILRERSPFATAMVTSEMLRTCAVRFDAIWFTESVRSRHTPDTSLTFACPPRRPAVPTSSATRVTSELNSPICAIMRFMMFAARRNSPCSGRPSACNDTVRVRSPFATADIESAMFSIGRTRSWISPLTEFSICAQLPCRLAGTMRCRVWPSWPTCWRTRASSAARWRLLLAISLKVSANRPSMPSQCRGSCTAKLPERTSCMACSSTCSGSPMVPPAITVGGPAVASASAPGAGVLRVPRLRGWVSSVTDRQACVVPGRTLRPTSQHNLIAPFNRARHVDAGYPTQFGRVSCVIARSDPCPCSL